MVYFRDLIHKFHLLFQKIKPKKIFFQGYSDLSSWLILISSILFRVKAIHWKGERVLRDNENISIIKKKIIFKIFFFLTFAVGFITHVKEI